ncbi:hypothetical protein [Rhizobium sp. BK176]|uniref:hypothetical protein n=1 Tax=Rhizobium sp. BK176 TaxID=2587071 RepID=UPI00216792BD|nr:hypothetical protein [Rhizobium sp. BK176]MCS4088811.1 hypothetical protein [Rhizobium sp. BK176]
MGMELSRRNLFRGLLAASALRFLPAVPMDTPTAPLVSRTLNPFAAGSSDRLTEMIVALLDDQHKMETIKVIRAIPSFRVEMLDDNGSGESVAETLTRHLGDGEWSEWSYTVDDVRAALTSLDREDELRRQALLYWTGGDRSITVDDATVAETQIAMPVA